MKKTCIYCGKEFETKTKTPYCSHKCHDVHKNLLYFPDGSDYTVCKICGMCGTDLHWHIKKQHQMQIEEYCKKFSIGEIDLQSPGLRKHNSDMQKKAYAEGRLHGWGKGDKNPSQKTRSQRWQKKCVFNELRWI